MHVKIQLLKYDPHDGVELTDGCVIILFVDWGETSR